MNPIGREVKLRRAERLDDNGRRSTRYLWDPKDVRSWEKSGRMPRLLPIMLRPIGVGKNERNSWILVLVVHLVLVSE